MKASRPFTGREKFMMAALALLILIIVYIFAVQQPVAENMIDLQDRISAAESDITLLKVKQVQKERMLAELKAMDEDSKLVPEYDSLSEELRFLNGILVKSNNYNIEFSVSDSDERVVRRYLDVNVKTVDYAGAEKIIEAIEAGPYRLTVNNLSMAVESDNNKLRSLNEGEVTTSFTLVFYETK